METLLVVTAAILMASASAAPQYQYQQPTAGYQAYGAGTTCSSCGGGATVTSQGGSSSEHLGSAANVDSSYSQAPQGGGNGGGGSSGFGQNSGQQGGGGGFGGRSPVQGGNLNTECRRQESGPGQYKFVCDGVQKDLITVRSEHILWLTSEGGKPQVVEIEVPNYKIDELIKAGYKGGSGAGTKINVLLKRPEQSAEAEVDVNAPDAVGPSVNLQYEQPEQTKIHFPNHKPYRPSTGPILPPLDAGRGRRQISGPVKQHQQVGQNQHIILQQIVPNQQQHQQQQRA